MKKIGIFTANSANKLHPRIAIQKKILEENNYYVQIIKTTPNDKERILFKILDLISLKYFKWNAIKSFQEQIDFFDIIHIYDFQLLPLAKAATNKKVIYETLDDNVFLHFHSLQKKLNFLRFFKQSITGWLSKYERKTATKYCDRVIINSPNLSENFNSSSLIYYCSSLENLNHQQFSENKKNAFLYLGKLSVAKGTNEYKKLMDKFKIPLIFFGHSADKTTKEFVDSYKVVHHGNLSSEKLKEKLTELLDKYNFVGLSVITPENKSYALQEANKDIEYMSLGIPFLGNHRKPTKEKIEEGAGVFFDDNLEIKLLLKNENSSYNLAGQRGLEIYQEKYAKEIFTKKLLSVFNNL